MYCIEMAGDLNHIASTSSSWMLVKEKWAVLSFIEISSSCIHHEVPNSINYSES